MSEKTFFLCSEEVINRFPECEKSEPFKSGWDFDEEDNYFVALLDFDELKKSEEEKPHVNFWCRECVPGTMSVSKITISSCRKAGLFTEIENKLNLTAERNQAMCIHNLSEKYNCTPIDFINKITKKPKQ